MPLRSASLQCEPVTSSVSPLTVNESAPRSISFVPQVFVSIMVSPAGVHAKWKSPLASTVAVSSPPATARTPLPSQRAIRTGPFAAVAEVVADLDLRHRDGPQRPGRIDHAEGRASDALLRPEQDHDGPIDALDPEEPTG